MVPEDSWYAGTKRYKGDIMADDENITRWCHLYKISSAYSPVANTITTLNQDLFGRVDNYR